MESNTDYAPSAQQQAIIDWAVNGKGSANVIARAGTGKTSTLVMVVEALVAADKGSIFLGAFNKKIADEIEAKLDRHGISKFAARAGTFHSVGRAAWVPACERPPKVNIWKSHDIVDGMLKDGAMSAFDHETYKAFIVRAVQQAKLSGVGVVWAHSNRARWQDMFDHFGMLDALSCPPQQTQDEFVNHLIALTWTALICSSEAARKVIDFDDMLWMPILRGVKIQQYDFVCIDEAQDTNEIRRELAMRMLKPGGRCIAVGDDRQAIYGFTGANADALDLIRKELNSVEFPLTTSYRCAKSIIFEAQGYVPDIRAWDGAPEGIVERVGESRWNMYDLTEYDAVLCRINAPLVGLAYECIRNGIPARIEGKDIAAGLLAIANRWKTSSLTVFGDHLQEWYKRESAKLRGDDGFVKRNETAKAAALYDKHATLLALVIASRSKYGEGCAVADMRQLIKDMFGDSKARGAKQMLTFCSVHKAKGMEWPHVCIYGANKFMPHVMATSDWEKGQEENLIYVAITRAKRKLTWVEIEEKRSGGGEETEA